MISSNKRMVYDINNLSNIIQAQEEAKESFKGYQDASPSNSDIRERQHSCYVKDLNDEDKPEFWKEIEKQSNSFKKRMTIKDIVSKVIFHTLIMQDNDDASLVKYK